MKDNVTKLTEKQCSTLLYQLAEKVGNVTDEEKNVERTVLNICEMTVINQYVMPDSTFEMNDTEDFYEDYANCDGIVVKSGVGNDEDVMSWNVGVYKILKELVIGDMCFAFVKGLKLMGMNALEKVEIGDGCFSKAEGKLEVTDCKKMKSLNIGSYSCVLWNEFVLKNCEVENVEIGDGCFVNCDLTVFEDLNELQSLKIGKEVFRGSKNKKNALSMASE